MNGEDYEAAKPVPARTLVTGDPWVRGHLPECAAGVTGSGLDCICDRLRACEKRIIAAIPSSGDEFIAGYEVGYAAGVQDERKRSVLLIADAYAAGVQAAREAVAAVPSQSESWSVSWVWKHDALAAIDALRGEA